MSAPAGLIASYRLTWREANRGQWFLIAGFLFAARILAFNVAFPLYAKAKGFDSSQIGLLLAAVAISLFIFGLPITRFGAGHRARRTLIAGPLIAAVGILVIIASPGDAFAPAVAGCLLAGMASNVFWVLGDPILAGVVPPEHRPRVFALKFSILTAGFAVGGLLGGWVAAVLLTEHSSLSSLAEADFTGGVFAWGLAFGHVALITLALGTLAVFPAE